MSELKKVTMYLSKKDQQNAAKLQKMLDTRSKAGAVSSSLAIAEMLAEMAEQGSEFYIKTKEGETQRVIIPGLGKHARAE